MVADRREPSREESDGAPVPIQSIERAANILALLDQDTRSLSPTLVANRLGMNRVTAHRYLQSLLRAGLLNASYGPGPLIDQLSALVSVREQLLAVAPPIMRQLSDATGLTSVLGLLGRSGAVVTLVEEANRGSIILAVRVGTVLELKAAQTRVLLAHEPDPAVIGRVHGSLSPREAADERDELAAVRRQGLAWADLHREGFASVAVPVFVGDRVAAAMALLGTTAMLGPNADHSAERVRALKRAARTLTVTIDGQGAPSDR